MTKNIKKFFVIKTLKKVAKDNGKSANQNLLNALNKIPDNEEFVFQENTDVLFEKLAWISRNGYSDALIVGYFVDGLVKAKNTNCSLYKVLNDFFSNSGQKFIDNNKEK